MLHYATLHAIMLQTHAMCRMMGSESMNGLNFDDASPENLEFLYLNLSLESYCIPAEREGRIRAQMDRREVTEADIDHMIQTARYYSISSVDRRNFRVAGYSLQETMHIVAFHYIPARQEGLRWELLGVSPAVATDFDPGQYAFVQRSEEQL